MVGRGMFFAYLVTAALLAGGRGTCFSSPSARLMPPACTAADLAFARPQWREPAICRPQGLEQARRARDDLYAFRKLASIIRDE